MRLAWGAVTVLLLPGGREAAAQGQPEWVLSRDARNALADLWDKSEAERREQVACLAGSVAGDTVQVTAIRVLELTRADSVTAEAGRSIAECGPPGWMGTVHSHVRATDDSLPAPGFSPSDRTVMSEWVETWRRPGAFCVLHGVWRAYCDIYPPARLALPTGRTPGVDSATP